MRIVYFCTSPESGTHAGGVKVIYDHCCALNDMGINAAILHERRGYVYPWASRSVPVITCDELRATDHMVLPEIKAASCASLIIAAGLQYSIFVQNGYYLSECGRRQSDADICFAYANAAAILSISSDSSELIALHYPELISRIVNVRCSIEPLVFTVGCDKRNIITYMPRKNGRHAAAVVFALKRHLPADWNLWAIDGMKEHEVANALQASRIFMSFSDLEGLGLPPLEAALCGNYVIGYHGGGGREYWRTPNFESVEAGDIGTFVKRVIARAEQLNKVDPNALDALRPGIEVLRERYSTANELAGLRRFTNLLNNLNVGSHKHGPVRLDILTKLQRRSKLRSWFHRPMVRASFGANKLRQISRTLIAKLSMD
jgi:hypothetical protein